MSTNTRASTISSVWVFTAILLLFLVCAPQISSLFTTYPALSTAATVFSGIFVQAIPFVALGVLVSALIAAYFPGDAITRWLPTQEKARVLAAALAGIGVPGCECASVPIAGRMIHSGVGRGAAIAFLLSAPAINPVVIASTFVAFPQLPAMAFARFGASLVTAWVVGFIFLSRSLSSALPSGEVDTCAPSVTSSRWSRFLDAAQADFLSAGSFLVLGAGCAALMHSLIPPSWLATLGGNIVSAIAVMACFAVILSVCSQADAFVAASFTSMPSSALLVFLVLSPMLDVKLIAMHLSVFGSRFTLRLDCVIVVVAMTVATLVGMSVFGVGI